MGRRTDVLVRQMLPHMTLGTIMKWLRQGKVRLNGQRVKPSTRVAQGDSLSLPEYGAQQVVPKTEQASARARGRFKRLLDIVYEDDDLLIVNKPAQLACHAGTKHTQDSLIVRVQDYLDSHQAPVGHRPGLAQRLDLGVSGLIPIGKNARTLRCLAQESQTHGMQKTYWALVHGAVERDAGNITVPLTVGDEPMGNRPRVYPDPHGKPAYTEYRVLKRYARCTWLAIRIETGRTHQIRAHLRYLGHAILGDPRYAEAAVNQYWFETWGLKRIGLHAAALTMQHPKDARPMTFALPWPKELARLVQPEPATALTQHTWGQQAGIQADIRPDTKQMQHAYSRNKACNT